MTMLADVRVLTVIPAAADALAGTKTSDALKMTNYEHAKFILSKGAGAVGRQTITLEKCTLADGTGAEAIPFVFRKSQGASGVTDSYIQATTSGFQTDAQANNTYEIEVSHQMEGLARGDKPFIRLRSVESVDDPVTATVIAVLSGGRYYQAAVA